VYGTFNWINFLTTELLLPSPQCWESGTRFWNRWYLFSVLLNVFVLLNSEVNSFFLQYFQKYSNSFNWILKLVAFWTIWPCTQVSCFNQTMVAVNCSLFVAKLQVHKLCKACFNLHIYITEIANMNLQGSETEIVTGSYRKLKLSLFTHLIQP
jgi:hypothetical protein